jgi:putative transposase
MSYHRRNLPHYYPPEAILFVTFRLFGSLPIPKLPTQSPVTAGKAFVAADRALDRATTGPQWLKDPRIAGIVAEAIHQGETNYHLYETFSWVIMSNHVHLVIRPSRPLPQVTRWLKGSTARAANLVLCRTGQPFWAYESYDHCVRNPEELDRIIGYVERNPVTAGLVPSMEDWPWSSANAGQVR